MDIKKLTQIVKEKIRSDKIGIPKGIPTGISMKNPGAPLSLAKYTLFSSSSTS